MVNTAALFNAKAKAFVAGRKGLFSTVENGLANEHRAKIWIHCASLGEYEQGRPLIEFFKKEYPNIAVVLTFFSPSGYQVQKDKSIADYVFYLSIDTKQNALRFVGLLQPVLAIFVKYEFWYHYLHQLNGTNVPTILVSALFQPRHPFFKWYGALHRVMLSKFTHLFVQDEASVKLLSSIGVSAVTIAGDTRFDRAYAIAQQATTYAELTTWKQHATLIVAGSTWAQDEALLLSAMQLLPAHFKLLIAPHQINEENITRLQNAFNQFGCSLWTKGSWGQQNRVLILNTMGQLASVYKYANAVWIGGGFSRSGIHNSVEAAVYGLPLFWGPNYQRYQEAIMLIKQAAAISTNTAEELCQHLTNEKALLPMGNNAQRYVLLQLGATRIITDYLSEKYLDTKL